MNKKILIIVSIGLLICLVVFSLPFRAYSDEPEGFRELKWKTPLSEFEHLTLTHQYGSSKEMAQANEDLDFNGFKAQRILFLFDQDRLETVAVQFETEDKNQKDALEQYLISQYGPQDACGAADTYWNGQKTDIKYNVYGKGVELIFTDADAWSKRVARREAFTSKALAFWRKLSSGGDVAGAASVLKKWLTQEGRYVLESFSVSDDGEEIVLVFKGADTIILNPVPGNAPQRLDKEKIYSIAEVEDIFKNKPEILRGKDILLKCVAVDLVAGIGCNDYFVLQDPGDADLFKRRYEKDLTFEEEVGIKKMPRILSAPTLGMPGNMVVPMKSAVYRGHFFDVNLSPCADGWKRFVILDKEKE